MESGIYRISWIGSGYFYYGQSISLRKRKSVHFARFRKGNHENNKMQKIYSKYGDPIFEIIEFCDPSELSEKEQKLLNAFYKTRFCCNLSPIATGGGHPTKEHVKEMLRNLKSGKKISESHKINIGIGLKKYYLDSKKRRDINGCNNPMYGKKHSELYKINSSKSRMGKGVGGTNPNAKILLNTQTGIYYSCAAEASETLSVCPSYIRKRVTGLIKNNTSFIGV